MIKLKSLSAFLTTVILLLLTDNAISCSMYKVTINGKTMVGCNEDAWRLTSRIWFENGTKQGNYGLAFTGSRYEGKTTVAPQSGMNEYGLAFSRLAAHTPENGVVETNKKGINNPTQYLKDILHTCKTVEEVRDYINQYDHSSFAEDVFIYIDKSGKYLIVEPYTLTIGHDSKYVLSNFCPSVTDKSYALKMAKYRKGVEFRNGAIDTTLSFCTALSDTMHVCRQKIGDGTLLTSIWDLNNGMTYLYFYHDYKHLVQFNLKEELAKGDHILEIPTLFPTNSEFEKLANFKIPYNDNFLMSLVLLAAALFFFSSFYFLINYFFTRKNTKYAYIKLLLLPIGLMMCCYMYVLAKNINVFYFPAPYQDYKFTIQNIFAYIPFAILLLIIPLFRVNLKVFKEHAWRNFPKWLFAINNLTYLTFIILFMYWGLFNIFG